MAVTETRQELTPSGEVRMLRPYKSRWLDWLTTTDHKMIGKMYMVTAFAFLLAGGIMAILIRTQLGNVERSLPLPGITLSEQVYNEMFTMHGTVMVFLFVMPMIAGFANYIVPLQIGALDMAFPRVNAFSYWLVVGGGLLLFLSYFTGGPPAAGWTSYSPLAGPQFSVNNGVDLWIGSIAVLGVASVTGGINFLVTIFKMRAPGMTMLRLPIFCWTMVVQAILLVFSIPVITGGLVMLWIDRNLGGGFYDPAVGGDPILYQHVFWYFGHPEVYVLILPIMGVISETIPVFSRKPLFGYKAFIFATLSIGALGTAVWAHHMFTTGSIEVLFFSATSFLIAVPTGVKIFNWSATMFKGKIVYTAAMLFAIGFLIEFLIGGVTGVVLGSGSADFALHDTYFVVSHFHFVLVSAALMGIFAALYYWFPKFSGRMLNEALGKWQFLFLFVGVNLTFFPQYILGLRGMPRRIQTYDPSLVDGWGLLNALSTYGSYLIGIAVLLFLINFFWSRRRGEIAGNNPWEGYTLEWWTTSPPPYFNFESLPPVRSNRPVFDYAHPDVEEVHG